MPAPRQRLVAPRRQARTVTVSSFDDEDMDEKGITDEAAWQHAVSIMVLYEQFIGHAPVESCGAWVDPRIERKLLLNQRQRRVIAILCDHFLFGFRAEGATEHQRAKYQPMVAEKNLKKLMTDMKMILDHRARFFTADRKLSETKVSRAYASWIHVWHDGPGKITEVQNN
jgi:hypothetical protein